MNNLLNKVLCLNCGHGLTGDKNLVQCPKCREKYFFDDGVLIMLSNSSWRNEQNLSQKHYYEQHYQTAEANKNFEWKRRWVKRVLNFLPKKNPSFILDLACGQAYMTLAVAKKGHQVIACDISLSGLKRARKEAVKLGIEKNILFIAGDINTLRFKKKIFDFVIMLHILEHLVNDKEVIKNVIFSAKANARYYIGAPLSLSCVFPLFIPLYLYSDHKVGHLRRYSLESILGLFDFKAEDVYTIYTGHLIKFLGLFLSKIGINTWEKTTEDLDEKMLKSRLWASNITTVIRKKD